jgi:hypothetical protein
MRDEIMTGLEEIKAAKLEATESEAVANHYEGVK